MLALLLPGQTSRSKIRRAEGLWETLEMALPTVMTSQTWRMRAKVLALACLQVQLLSTCVHMKPSNTVCPIVHSLVFSPCFFHAT